MKPLSSRVMRCTCARYVVTDSGMGSPAIHRRTVRGSRPITTMAKPVRDNPDSRRRARIRSTAGESVRVIQFLIDEGGIGLRAEAVPHHGIKP
jgi:hypothetical protein